MEYFNILMASDSKHFLQLSYANINPNVFLVSFVQFDGNEKKALNTLFE